MNKADFKIFMGIIILMVATMTQAMKPVACTGVKKQCDKDVRTDKTIDGQAFSCYECKQTVCKSGGSGPIAGTETTTVCESKPASGRALIDSQDRSQFDEADALFGQRTEVKRDESNPSTPTSTGHTQIQQINPEKRRLIKTVDHRKKRVIKNRPERGTKAPVISRMKAPTDVTLYDVTDNKLTISWMDHANNEYGVSVERGKPMEDRGGINFNWQHVFNVEERIDSNVKGSGWRTDGDDGLAANTEYCYRLRAYRKAEFSDYSQAVCVRTVNKPVIQKLNH